MPYLNTVKFLLVDDVQENLTALQALLKREGLELFAVSSAADALELLLVHDFDLALLDVQMPETDGFELAQLMRGTERTRQIPIIFLTAVATDERRKFQGYESGAVDYLLKPIDGKLLQSKAAVFFDLAKHRRQITQQRDQLQVSANQLSETLARLNAHSDNSPLGVVEFDPQLRVLAWHKSAERLFGWQQKEVLGQYVTDFLWLHEDSQNSFERFFANLNSKRQDRPIYEARVYRKDRSVIECEWYVSSVTDNDGHLVSIVTQILDVTERKHAEQTQQLLVGELNHRVKNTLATVQAIATQTLRHSGSPDAFAANFSGRIQSLARAHSLLSDKTWKGAGVIEIVKTQLQLGAIDESRFTSKGPDAWLTPQMALHFALILHELGTNASKYGALMTDGGRIDLNWTVDNNILRLIWTESGGPSVKAPTRRGFGTALIEQSVKAEGGAAKVSYRSDGLTWEISFGLAGKTESSEDSFISRTPLTTNRLSKSAASGRLAGLTFLIVEDEPLVAIEIAEILQGAGGVICGEATTADQALQLIGNKQPTVALLDCNLRGESAEKIAIALLCAHVPFAFVSGYGSENLPEAFRNVPLINKPFTPEQLLKMVTELLPLQSDVVKLFTKPGRQN